MQYSEAPAFFAAMREDAPSPGRPPAKPARRSWLNQQVPPDVVRSFGDRDRLCPMLAGAGWLEGSRLSLRLPAGDWVIQAPRRLLQAVWRLCDGTLTFNEVLSKVPPAQAGEMEAFLCHLLEQGALIDAIFATRAAAQYAWQAVPVGRAADEELTLRIGKRFTEPAPRGHAPSQPAPMRVGKAPLSEFFAQRRSVTTFDDRAIAPRTLACLLWSMGGVLSLRHPNPGHAIAHRTLASGGAMYLVRWMLVLRSPVGGYAPGVYDVVFSGEREVSLVARSPDLRLLNRAFFKPWQLSHATGAIFGVAQADVAALRYRNRALQYLFTEAGAALQNMALSAPPLGLATSIIGGYCEETAKSLLGLRDEILVGSALFGSAPTQAQLNALASMHPIDFVWSDSVNEVYSLPFHIARARPKGLDSDEFNTWGKDADPRMAYVKAHAESVERQGAREPRDIEVACMADVPNPVHPARLAAYTDAQYAQAGFPYARFDPAARHCWAPGVEVLGGARVSVPAQFLYGRKLLLPFLAGQSAFIQSNSSGCAAGTSLESALQAGLLEVIERDAFMRHWLAQTPGVRIGHRSLPASLLARVKQMRSHGCEVTLQALDPVAAHVVLVSAVNPGRHFTCVAAAARFDQAEACAAALDELETMVFTRLVGMDFEKLAPRDVADPGGHSVLYAQKAWFRRAGNVLRARAPGARRRAGPNPACANLRDLCEALAAAGLKPAFVDITPRRNCIDQGRTALTVVKAIVPGLIPVSFGYGREPRGMVPAVHRQSLFPHPFP